MALVNTYQITSVLYIEQIGYGGANLLHLAVAGSILYCTLLLYFRNQAGPTSLLISSWIRKYELGIRDYPAIFPLLQPCISAATMIQSANQTRLRLTYILYTPLYQQILKPPPYLPCRTLRDVYPAPLHIMYNLPPPYFGPQAPFLFTTTSLVTVPKYTYIHKIAYKKNFIREKTIMPSFNKKSKFNIHINYYIIHILHYYFYFYFFSVQVILLTFFSFFWGVTLKPPDPKPPPNPGFPYFPKSASTG